MIIDSLMLFTILSGVGLVGAESYSAIMSSRRKKIDKVGTAYVADTDIVENLSGNDGLIISKDIQLGFNADREGVCILGPTGSGKTTSFFFPNLLKNNITGSIIVTDPKGELFEKTSKFQEEVCGRKVYKFCPLNPEDSEYYNILTECKDTSEVLQLASMLLFNGSLSIELQTGKKAGGVEWIQMAEPLFAASLLYAKEQEYPFNTVEFALELIVNLDTDSLYKIFSNAKNPDVMKQYRTFLTVGGADRTEGSIKITLATNLKLFNDPKINQVSSKTTFDIETFRKVPSILYIIYPERKSSYISPFIAPFFSQAIDKLLDTFEEDNSLNIHMLFDEFANIGMLNNMSGNAATCRSRNISLSVCLQSISQLFQVYGAYNAKAILNNLKTKVVLPGLNDEDTLRYISSLCGETEITTKTYNMEKGVHETYSKSKKRLFENGEIRTLNDDEMLVVCHNKQPILDLQLRYYKHKEFTNNIEKRTLWTKKRNLQKFDYSNKIMDLKLETMIVDDEEDAEGLDFRES